MVSLESGNLKAIVRGYRESLQWASTDDNDNSLEGYEFSQVATDQIVLDCQKFFTDNLDAINSVLEISAADYGYENIGHDFFLTRAGHGVGFWDRGFGKLGDDLTAKCKEFGESTPYIGDDELIYVL